MSEQDKEKAKQECREKLERIFERLDWENTNSIKVEVLVNWSKGH